MKRIIIITGQTATGKTSLALKLARKYNGELINCDSRQLYKHLDIITGKDKQHLKKVKVWLYDVVTPNQYFSSYDFVKLAVPAIKKILSQHKTPIIVGGTYFYLKHLLYGIETENIPPNWPLRKELANKSVRELQKLLRKYSIQLIKQLNQSELNNRQRLIRKIEIAAHRRDVINHVSTKKNKLNIPDLKIKFIGLKFKSKESLRHAIEKRVEERLKLGAIDEVKKLLKMGFTASDPGLKTIGYQQVISYLKGKLSINEAIADWINKEVQYAKRQYTFMKKDKNIKWQYI